MNSINVGNFKSRNPAFTGRLFDSSGDRVKSFEFLGMNDDMEKRGSSGTDVFVHDIISEKNAMGGYDNSIEYSIKNPLFGRQSFHQELRHETNSPVKGETSSELWHLDLFTGMKSNDCKDLEDRALKATLIDRMKIDVKISDSELNPINTLSKMLSEAGDNHGFSSSRIDDFKQIAKKLSNELMKIGLGVIKK